MDAALLLAALASRAGDRVDLLAYDRRVRAAVQGRAARDVLPSAGGGHGAVEPALVETDARGLTAAVLRTAPAALPGRAAHRARRGPGRGGSAARPAPAHPAAHGPRRLGGRPACRRAWRGPRQTPTRCTRRRLLLGRRRSGTRTAEQLRRHGVTVVDAAPDDLAPALADAYLALKAAGRL